MQRRHVAFTAILVGAMAGSSFSLFAMSVLAADLIDTFDVTRGEIGIVLAANTASGAILAPTLGRWTDRIGGRNSIVTLLVVSGVGLTLIAAAQSYGVLLAGSLLAGAPQGWGNPATNKLIAERLEEGQRGLVLGVKQSGVQVSVFLAGATMPVFADVFGWRSAFTIYAVASLLLAAVAALRLGETDESRADRAVITERPRGSIMSPLVVRLTLYATAMGLAGGMINRFIPLFAHEALGYSTTVAGVAVAINGLMAIGTRIWWSSRAERTRNSATPLVVMGVLTAVTALLLSLATSVGAWLLWPAAIAGAWSVSAWNGVAMLRVVDGVDTKDAGRASGVVIFGFLGGLAVGAPVAGWSVDQFETYGVTWIAALLLGFAAALAIDRRVAAPGSER